MTSTLPTTVPSGRVSESVADAMPVSSDALTSTLSGALSTRAPSTPGLATHACGRSATTNGT